MGEWPSELYDNVWSRLGGVKRHHLDLHARVAAFVPRDAGSIVDIGCGTGEMLARLEKAGHEDLTGYDFSPVALALAAKRTSAAVSLICADIHLIDFRHYDFAILTEVLEHIEDDRPLLPDRWVASVPNGPTTAPNHVRTYTPEDVVERYGPRFVRSTPRFIIFGT